MLGIVIVSYRSDEETVAYVRNELSRITAPHRIVVIDNGATEEEAAALGERIPEADVIAAPNNGYAFGNNAGFRYLMERFNPEYVLFTNNDIHLSSDDVTDVLCRTLDRHPEAGAAGPEVVGLDGLRQGPEPYVGMWKRYVWMYLSSPFLSLKAKRRIFMLDAPSLAEEGPCYKLQGSFFIVRSEDFRQAGMFDENTFLYAEENILSDRLGRIGKTCWFTPSVRVVHEHGKTISRNYDTVRRSWMQWESMRYYYRTYRGASRLGAGIVGMIYRLILLLKKGR